MALKNALAALAFFFSGCAAHLPGDALNPGFEEVQGGQIASWRYPAAAPGLRVFADSSAARSGRYALAVHKERTDIAYVAITNSTTVAAGLEQVTVEAEFKGTLAHGSRASLWIRVEDSNGSILGLANEGTDGVPGSDGWYPTRVALKAGAPGPVTVYFGVLLQGTGRLWVDNYSIRINGAATWEQVPAGDGPAAARDTAFGHGSALDAQLVEARSHTVEKAGEVWAFLKYYHPAFYLGEKNCDAEWFRLLHQVSAHPESEGDLVIERWVAALGSLPDRKDSCAQSRNARPAGFGRLFRPGFLTASLREQLKAVAAAYPGVASQYTVGLDPSVQTALQKNERPYRELAYPDAGVRLLALFRLWGFFQYFSPNLDLATRWDEVPAQFVRPMLQSRNAAGYRSVLAEVIARMNDGHAGLTDYHGVLDSMAGRRSLPLECVFVTGALVVTGAYGDSAWVPGLFKRGDIIRTIDGVDVQEARARQWKFVSGSNDRARLAALAAPGGYLLRSNSEAARVTVIRDGHPVRISCTRIPVFEAMKKEEVAESRKPAWRLLNDQVGYIYPGSLKPAHIDSIKARFAPLRAIVIDLRCYPSLFIPYLLGDWLKGARTPFGFMTQPSLCAPGAMTVGQTFYNGPSTAARERHFKGSVFILVNHKTISQAEFTAMAFSSRRNAYVIGSQTAGADGDVTQLTLPGGLVTRISGIGIYYPDGTNTQGAGIRVDVAVAVSLAAIRAGRDEVLEQALLLAARKEPWQK